MLACFRLRGMGRLCWAFCRSAPVSLRYPVQLLIVPLRMSGMSGMSGMSTKSAVMHGSTHALNASLFWALIQCNWSPCRARQIEWWIRGNVTRKSHSSQTRHGT